MVLCALCLLTIKRNQLSIICKLCNQIFHKNCIFPSDINPSINFKEWNCSNCLENMTPINPNKNKSDSAKLEELIKLVKSLELKITQQESKISKKLDETLKSLNDVISENNILKEKVSVLEKKVMNFEQTDFLNEILERDRRKCNIILFNAPEPTSDNASKDLNLVNSIFSTLKLPIKALNTLRLGNNVNKPRPLKVILPDVNCVNQILKAKSGLRNVDTLKHLNISTDKTKLQLEQYKTVLNTLLEKKNRGETNFRIGYSRGNPIILPKN